MSENPLPRPEQRRAPEDERRDGITPGVAHLALAAEKQSFIRHEVRSVTDTQLASLESKNPQDLDPVMKAAGEVSLESRQDYYKNDTRAFNDINRQWNEHMWNSLNDFVHDQRVDDAVQDERRLALSAVGLNMQNMQENGLHKEVESFRKKYTGRPDVMEGLRLFMDDLAHGCATQDGKIDTAAYHRRLEAVKPLLSVFGIKDNVALMVADLALARATLTQEGSQRKALTTGIRQKIQVPLSRDEKVYLDALAEKMGLSHHDSLDPAPPAPPNDAQQSIVQPGRRIRGADGKYYTIANDGKGETPFVAQADDGDLVAGQGLLKSLEQGELDVLQTGKTIMRREGNILKLFSVIDIKKVDGQMMVTLKGRDGQDSLIKAEDLRQFVTTENSGWKVAKDILTAGEPLVMSELSRDVWAVLMDEYPEFEKVFVVHHIPEREQNPATGGGYVHPEDDTKFPAVMIRKDYAPALAFIREKGSVVLDLIAEKLGIDTDKLTDEVIEAFILLHEAGHAHDYKGITKEQEEAKRKADIDTLPARNLADFVEKYPQATEDQIRDFARQYRNTTTERAADDFAVAFIKGHPELFGQLQQKDTFPSKEALDAPLNAEEEAFGLAYLMYMDVVPDQDAALKYMRNKNPRTKYYVRELQNTFAAYGKDFVLQKAQEAVLQLQANLAALGIDGTQYKRSPSWYLWHTAKSRFLAEHSDVQQALPNGEKYKPYDPLLQYKEGVDSRTREASQVAEREIMDTQFGWEACNYQQHSEDLMTRVGSALISEDRSRLQDLLGEMKEDTDDHLLPSYKLKEVGEILSRSTLITSDTPNS